jgi:long-chain acyl-CoA synthetase
MAISRDVHRRAAAEPRRLAVVGPYGKVTFAELGTRVELKVAALVEQGVESGGRVEVTNEDPVELLVGLIAADQLDAAAIVGEASWPAELRARAVGAAIKKAEPHGSNACLIVFTSGSEGTPKPVVRTRRSWTFSFPTFSVYAGVGPNDTVLIPGKLSGSLFLYGTLHALTMGAAVHLLPKWNADQAAEAAAECTAAHLVPPMLAALVDRLDTGTSLNLAVCAGAPLDNDVEERAAKLGIEVVEYYGAAELSLVAIKRPGKRLKAFPSVEIRIQDGVLWAKSIYLASGLDKSEDGFATVHDHAILNADGSLEITGRANEAISSGGSTVNPEGVERVLRQLPGVADVAVVGRQHPDLGQVVAAVLEGTPPAVEVLRKYAADQLVEAERPRLWYAIDALPRTASGKVARGRVLDGLADGSLDARTL